jgi:hypothetical protein
MAVGIFLMILGAVFMMKTIGLLIPTWVLSWHTILLAAGLLIGLSKNLRFGGWMVLVLVGSIFTLKDVLSFDISGYTTALLLIGLGIYMIFKPKGQLHFCDSRFKKQKVEV